jgi:hypothetical protein
MPLPKTVEEVTQFRNLSWRSRRLQMVLGKKRSPALGSRFRAENTLEAGAGELDADHALAVTYRFAHVYDAALGFEVVLGAARKLGCGGNANLEIGADGHVEAGAERSSATAEIFAGSVFFEAESAGIAAANAQRQTDGNSTFRPLPRKTLLAGDALAAEAHGLGPPQVPLSGQRSAPRYPPLPLVCAPCAQCGVARCRSPRHA